MDLDDLDPTLSDEQLMALFTPKQREMFEWWQENEYELLHAPGLLGTAKLIRKKFPTDAENEEYNNFSKIWHGRARRRMNYCMPVGSFLDLVQQTTFNDIISASELRLKMEMTNTPLIELGTSACGGKTFGYGIRTGGYFLWPNLEDNPTDPSLLDRSMLGINLNVTVEYRSPQLLKTPLTPRRRRREQRSSGEDSVESADSTDPNHEHGFTFAQIGALYVAKKIRDTTYWLSTGFGVVVEVKPYGQTGAVWVVYNFFMAHEESALERGEHIETLDDNDALLPNLGRLYSGCTEQFTVAKIANSLDDLRQPREGFDFEIEARSERQLVRAKLGGIQRLVQRQYINRSHRSAV